jgi:hypothetical protein
MRVEDLSNLGDQVRAAAQARRSNGTWAGQAADEAERDTITPWPELQELPSAADPEPEAFPTHGLGPILGPAAAALAETVQAPAALAAGSVLAAAAVLVQGLADVEAPHGLIAPISLFIVSVGGSGDRKSAVDSVAIAPIEEERGRESAEQAAQRRRFDAEQAERRAGNPDPSAPVARSLTVSQGTVEGFQRQLRGQPTLGLLSREGAEVLGGHSMREERRAAGVAWLCKAWDGATLDSLTKGDGLSVLIGRRFSMHVMLQPVVAQALLTDPVAQGQGLLARCLIAAPRSIAGTRLFRDGEVPAQKRPEVLAFHARLRGLLSCRADPRAEGDGVELARRTVRLSDKAHLLWVEFYNEVEIKQGSGRVLCDGRVKPWASKAAEHALRLAAVIELAGNPEATEISPETMYGAIGVATFYLGEFLRLLGLSAETAHGKRLALLLGFLRERGPMVPHADVLQRSPRELRALKAEGLSPLLDELARLGYIRRRGDAWEVRKC